MHATRTLAGLSDEDVFVIHHFAGDVVYTSVTFLEKNTDIYLPYISAPYLPYISPYLPHISQVPSTASPPRSPCCRSPSRRATRVVRSRAPSDEVWMRSAVIEMGLPRGSLSIYLSSESLQVRSAGIEIEMSRETTAWVGAALH